MRDKHAKFIELANKRVNVALKALRLVGNLSNRGNYEYSDDEARRIIRALQKEMEATKAKFTDGGIAADGEFRL